MSKSEKKIKQKKTANILYIVIGLIVLSYSFTAFEALLSSQNPDDIILWLKVFVPFIIGTPTLVTGIIGLSEAKKLNRVYEKCFSMLSADPFVSIEYLAANITITYAENYHGLIYKMAQGDSANGKNNIVINVIKELINRGYLPNGAYFDPVKNCVAYMQEIPGKEAVVEYVTVICKGCGAANKILKGSVVECEYCSYSLE